MDKLKKYGFKASTDTSTFNDVFEGKTFRKIHIDAYNNQPYMLFGRMVVHNARIALEEGRVILRDKNDIILVDIPLESICEYYVKKCKEYCHYVVRIKDVYYNVLMVL